MASKARSIDPRDFPDEEFDLYSIPAHDETGFEVLTGAAIGSSKKLVMPGDVLISRIVPHIRRVRIVGDRGSRRQIASGEWIIFRSNDFDAQYFRHLLLSDLFHAHFMSTTAGVGGSLIRARPAYVKRIKVALPNRETQHHIATILDKGDALRTKYQQKLARLDELPQAIFHQRFGQLTNFRQLKYLAEIHSGGTPSKARSDYWEGTTPWFSAKDLKAPHLFDSQDHISEKVFSETNLKLMPPETIALVVRGMILDHSFPISLLRVDAAINQDLKALRPRPGTDIRFLAEALRAKTPWVLAHIATAGHGTKRLQTSVLEKIPIPAVDISAQQEYAHALKKIEAQREKAESVARLHEELFVSLQARAFSGNL